MGSKGLEKVLQEKDKHIADLKKDIDYYKQLYKQQAKEIYQLELKVKKLEKELKQFNQIKQL